MNTATLREMPSSLNDACRRMDQAAEEVERLRELVLDACNVFVNYDLPEHAFHYRRAVVGLDQAKKMAQGAV